MDSFDPFDQGNRQPERPAQIGFFPRHLTIIALMVKARQMQDSVQHQDLDFLRQRDGLDERNFDGQCRQRWRCPQPVWDACAIRRWVNGTETTTRPLLCSGCETGGSASGWRHCWSPARLPCREVPRPCGHVARSVAMRSRLDRDLLLQNEPSACSLASSSYSDALQKQTGGRMRSPPQGVTYPLASADDAFGS